MNQDLRSIGAALALLFTTPALAQSDVMSPDDAIATWAAAFNNCMVKSLSALYAPDATLWGTNARSLIATPSGIRSYFDGACTLQPPFKVTIGEHTTRVFGPSAASAGTYSFVRDGKIMAARFSFALVRSGGRWLIVQHHSSVLPGSL
ncbi:MAG: DUF4440 domain-containing protein [Burkholderiaceae bacterium]